jgi:hypothetical protein
MAKQVRVYYKGYDFDLDKLIEKALEDAGLEWYASGYDLRDGSEERQLCFDYEPQERHAQGEVEQWMIDAAKELVQTMRHAQEYQTHYHDDEEVEGFSMVIRQHYEAWRKNG